MTELFPVTGAVAKQSAEYAACAPAVRRDSRNRDASDATVAGLLLSVWNRMTQTTPLNVSNSL